MEKIRKIGEIECETQEFADWVLETLENTGFIVNSVPNIGVSLMLEIFEKR